MKHKNPYIFVCIVWAVTTVTHSVNVVVQMYAGNRIMAIVWLVAAVAWAFVTGIYLRKAREIAKINRFFKAQDQLENAFDEFIENLHKEEENRPFKEFESEKEGIIKGVKDKEKNEPNQFI